MRLFKCFVKSVLILQLKMTLNDQTKSLWDCCLVAAMFYLDLTAVSALCSVPRCTAAVIVPHSGNSSQGAAVIVVNSAAHSAVCCGPSHHLHTPSVAFSPAPDPPLQMVVWYSGCKVRALALLSVLYAVYCAL